MEPLPPAPAEDTAAECERLRRENTQLRDLLRQTHGKVFELEQRFVNLATLVGRDFAEQIRVRDEMIARQTREIGEIGRRVDNLRPVNRKQRRWLGRGGSGRGAA